MARDQIYQEIERERAYQDGKWGTAFDDANTLNDWAIVKVAAIAVAALEAFDRNGGFAPRHYDSAASAPTQPLTA